MPTPSAATLAPTDTPVPLKSTPTPLSPAALLGIEGPINMHGTEFRVVAVKEVDQVMDMKAAAGFRLLRVSVEVSQGSAEEVKDWNVSLRDAAGSFYQPLTSGWGVFHGGANMAGWTFSVPKNTKALWLILPDDVSVDLAPLVQEMTTVTSESETDQTITAAPVEPVTIPDITIPDITIPDITIPDITVPDITIPDITVPDIAVPAPAIPSVTPMPRPAGLVTIDILNLRAGPDTDHGIKGQVHRGDSLQILGQQGNCAWLEVITPQKRTGWVAGQYVTLDVPCNSIPAVTARPLTGTILRDSTRSGLGELTVDNGTQFDGVVVLVQLNDVPVTAFYVRSAESFTLKGIRDGIYHLLFTTGEAWNGDEARFTKAPRFQRFEDALNFTTTPTVTGKQYSIWKVTLHPVAGGTAETESLSPGQFPDLK